jgi:hypothetical protein
MYASAWRDLGAINYWWPLNASNSLGAVLVCVVFKEEGRRRGGLLDGLDHFKIFKTAINRYKKPSRFRGA